MYFDSSVCLFTCPNSQENSQLTSFKDSVDQPNHFSAFFKCCPVDTTTRHYTQCSFTTDVRSDFTNHLRKMHKSSKFFCIYCSDVDNFHKVHMFDTGILLVRHIDTYHRNRYFQCSLCPYRAITADHVNIHQAHRHCNFFQSDGLNKCQILFCKTPPLNPELTLKYFYDNYKTDYCDIKQYQCLYCNFASKDFQYLILHQVFTHQDYPLLYYSPKETVDSNNKNKNCTNYKISDDETLLTSDEEECVYYICFFCDTKLTSADAMKHHTLKHLFPSEQKSYDIFFENWINWFVSTQHTFHTTDLHEESSCPICAKLSTCNVSLSMSHNDSQKSHSFKNPKIHYILHSCYKPIKCLLCIEEKKGDFWLPNLMRRIVKHLLDFHKEKLNTYERLKSFQINSSTFNKFSIKDWSKLKFALIKESVILEYSTKNDNRVFKQMSIVDRQALKLLDSTYSKHLSTFNSKSNGKVKKHIGHNKTNVVDKKSLANEVILLTDDDDSDFLTD